MTVPSGDHDDVDLRHRLLEATALLREIARSKDLLSGLSPEERTRTLVLSRALATRDVDAGRAVFAAEPDVELDYLERVDSRTFTPDPDGDLIVVAAKVGTTRLLDNLLLTGS